MQRTKSNAVRMILDQGVTFEEAIQKTGISAGAISRAVKHFKQTGEYYPVMGRPTRLDTAALERLSAVVTDYATATAALSGAAFAKLVHAEEKQVAKRRGKRLVTSSIDIGYARRLVKR